MFMYYLTEEGQPQGKNTYLINLLITAKLETSDLKCAEFEFKFTEEMISKRCVADHDSLGWQSLIRMSKTPNFCNTPDDSEQNILATPLRVYPNEWKKGRTCRSNSTNKLDFH